MIECQFVNARIYRLSALAKKPQPQHIVHRVRLKSRITRQRTLPIICSVDQQQQVDNNHDHVDKIYLERSFEMNLIVVYYYGLNLG